MILAWFVGRVTAEFVLIHEKKKLKLFPVDEIRIERCHAALHRHGC